MGQRSVNWLEHTSRSISSRFPETRVFSDYIVQRLSALLLERLPSETSKEILELLPEPHTHELQALQICAGIDCIRKIGYGDFVDRTLTSIGFFWELHDFPKNKDEIMSLSGQIADAFLWAFAQEIPSDIKARMERSLPSEIRSRMNLYSAHSDDQRVA